MALKEIIMETQEKTPRPTPADVRVVSMAEYKEAAACLSDAFANDPVIRYPIYTKDMANHPEELKRSLHENMMEYATAAHILNGIVTTVGPDYASVALWLPPGKDLDSWRTLFQSGLWRLNYQLSKEGKKRFFSEFLPLLHDTKMDVLGDRDQESYYLVYLGTKTSEQGKGYGKALIQHMTNKADAENRPCYLESSAERNLPIYQARGFNFTKRIYLNYAEAPIALDIMVREPVARTVPVPVPVPAMKPMSCQALAQLQTLQERKPLELDLGLERLQLHHHTSADASLMKMVNPLGRRGSAALNAADMKEIILDTASPAA